MLREIGKGLIRRLIAYGVFALGAWLLLQGFLRPNIVMGVLGGVILLGGMYLLVQARRPDLTSTKLESDDDEKEEHPGDTIPGRNQSN